MVPWSFWGILQWRRKSQQNRTEQSDCIHVYLILFRFYFADKVRYKNIVGTKDCLLHVYIMVRTSNVGIWRCSFCSEWKRNVIRKVPHCSTLFITTESLHKDEARKTMVWLVAGGKIIVLLVRHALNLCTFRCCRSSQKKSLKRSLKQETVRSHDYFDAVSIGPFISNFANIVECEQNGQNCHKIITIA